MSSIEYYSMQEAARILDIKNFGRTKLMRLLKKHQIIMPNNCPGVQYVLDGYFTFIYKPIKGYHGSIMKVAPVPLVSDLGMDLIKTLIYNTHD